MTLDILRVLYLYYLLRTERTERPCTVIGRVTGTCTKVPFKGIVLIGQAILAKTLMNPAKVSSVMGCSRWVLLLSDFSTNTICDAGWGVRAHPCRSVGEALFQASGKMPNPTCPNAANGQLFHLLTATKFGMIARPPYFFFGCILCLTPPPAISA